MAIIDRSSNVYRYLRLLLAVTLLITMAISAFPVPVCAIADPDSPPSINATYVYNDLLEAGDCGILIEYFLDYAVIPPTGETAAEAYMGVFVDTDGTTQLRAVAPYVFQNSGYDGGVIWIYFTAAEVVTHSIDSANIALYRIWLVGNPTLTWVPGPDPPKTISTIDYWMPAAADPAVLLALRVLHYADKFELDWTLDLIEATPLGNRLTTLGESYFENVISDLRTMAPNCFSTGTTYPDLEDIDYETTFYAIAEDGTGTIAVSPTAFVEGSQSLNTTGAGTITFTLRQGTVGTVETDVGIVTGSPATIVAGTNTVTTDGGGNVTVVVNLVNTSTSIEDTVTGTGLDLTDAATAFGMTRWMFSGIVWFLLGIFLCAGTYKASTRAGDYDGGGSAGKTVMLIFDLWIIGGAILGLIHILVAAFLFIGFGALTGYVLFFRGANV